MSQMKIFSCSSNRPLADKIASYLRVNLGRCIVGRFSDGEIRVEIEENVRGDDVFIIQSTSFSSER